MWSGAAPLPIVPHCVVNNKQPIHNTHQYSHGQHDFPALPFSKFGGWCMPSVNEICYAYTIVLPNTRETTKIKGHKMEDLMDSRKTVNLCRGIRIPRVHAEQKETCSSLRSSLLLFLLLLAANVCSGAGTNHNY